MAMEYIPPEKKIKQLVRRNKTSTENQQFIEQLA
jgi:hypothetical protein